MSDFDHFSENLNFRFNQSLDETFESVSHFFKKWLDKTSDVIDGEILVPVSQKQLNDALQKFVTDNVDAILSLRVELHDDWFRLYCTVNVAGVYAEVASNFGLVHAQLDRNVQRFVFAQQTYTDVIKLHCESFVKYQGIRFVVWFYHRVLKKDPLGFILSYINIARPKDNIIYLDIHRWLKNNKKIISTLHKVQVNYALAKEEQLVFKTQINYRNLLSARDSDDIITDDDEPELMAGPINPISDATEPSQE